MTKQNPKNVKKLFLQHIESIQNKTLQTCCKALLHDYPEFWKARGAARKHHAYEGGLAKHVLEVIDIATAAADTMAVDKINKDWLITAGIFHDIAKIYEFEFDKVKKEFTYTWFGNHIYHISRSHAVWYKYAMHYGVNIFDMQNIEHILLSHHGRKDWGSPIEPKTKEAILFHYADNLSAKHGDKQ